MLILVLLCSIAPAGAAAAQAYTLTWEEDTENGGVAITGYTGDLSGTLEIPAKLEGKPVVSIRKEAFMEKTNITGLTLPDSLLVIEDGAFKDCKNLAGTLVLPAKLKTIGREAFSNTDFTGKLEIPAGIREIEFSSFAETDFTSLELHEGLETIGYMAFMNCKFKQENLHIPSTVIKLDNYAFCQCYGLSGTLSLPENIQCVGSSAFEGCCQLTGPVRIPAGLSDFSTSAFHGCTGLTDYTVDPGNEKYIARDGILYLKNGKTIVSCLQGRTGPLTIPEDVERIDSAAFTDCKGLTGELHLPENLKYIGFSAFNGCSGLTGKLIFPDTVDTIDGYAFSGCNGFTGTLDLPEKITRVEVGTFSGCRGFTGPLKLPEKLEYLGGEAFEGCTGFTGGIALPNTLEALNDKTFSGCTGFTGPVTLPEGIKVIPSQFFRNCSGLQGEIRIPESVTEIEGYAFYNCKEITSVKLPERLEKMGYCVFEGCTSLTSAPLPDGLKEIPDDTFYGCRSLTSLHIPAAAEHIGGEAFYNCSAVKGTLHLPATLKKIEDHAFLGCGGSGFTVDTANPVYSAPEGILATKDGKTLLACLTGKTGKLNIPAEVTCIKDRAFYRCAGLTGELACPAGLEEMGISAFEGCSGFTGTLTFPGKLTEIPDRAYKDCSGFTGLSIHEGIKHLGYNALQGCSGFTGKVTIPSTLETISDGAFAGCGGTEFAVDPENANFSADGPILLNKGKYEIYACLIGASGTLEIPEGIYLIQNYAFWDCTGFTGTAKIGPDLTSIGPSAFGGCGISEFSGDTNDKRYVSVDGMLFNSDTNSFFCCPAGRTRPVKLPAETKYLSAGAFRGCKGIGRALTLPPAVENIGRGAFSGSSLKEIAFTCEEEPYFLDEAFEDFSGTAFYPPTWSNFWQNNYGGDVTWFCRCGGEHNLVHHEAQAPTCTEAGWEAYDACTDCSYSTRTEIPALGHDWEKPVYQWNEEHTACTAQRTCRNDASHVETAEAVITEKKIWEPTAHSPGEIIYTAEFTVPWAETQKAYQLLPVPGKPDASEKFTDISKDAWYYEAVNYVYQYGLFGGMSENTFEPETPMSRAMLVMVLWRYEGEPGEGTDIFEDVEKGQWFAEPVFWAAHNGIVNGMDIGIFAPNENITREQMAAILHRYAVWKGINTDNEGDFSGFPDAGKVSGYAEIPMKWAVGTKLIGGSEGMLLPQGYATRAQVATILMRFIRNVGRA